MSTSPKDVTLYPEHGFALARPTTVVDGKVIERVGLEIAFHPGWQPGFTEVWDMTLSQGTNILPTDITRLKSLEDKTKDQLVGSRTIVITPRSLELYSVQFYARLVRPLGREVIGVRTRQEAAALLGIPELPTPEEDA